MVAVVFRALGDKIGLAAAALDKSSSGSSGAQLALGDGLLESGHVLGMNSGEMRNHILNGAVDGDAGEARVDLDVPFDVDGCVSGQKSLESGRARSRSGLDGGLGVG